MAGFVENLALGGAGVEDWFEHLTGIDPAAHHAADVYAAQTLALTGDTPDSPTGQALVQQTEQIEQDQGIVEKAAVKTVDQIADTGFSSLKKLLWIGGGLLALGSLAVIAFEVGPLFRAKGKT